MTHTQPFKDIAVAKQRTLLQQRVEELRQQGYMTTSDIARKYDISIDLVKKRLAKPDIIVRKGNTTYLYARARVVAEFEVSA